MQLRNSSLFSFWAFISCWNFMLCRVEHEKVLILAFSWLYNRRVHIFLRNVNCVDWTVRGFDISWVGGRLLHWVGVNTPGRRQSKTLILSTNKDKKSLKTEFSIAICRPTGDKWQSKTLFLAFFDPRSSIVKNVFDCRLPCVVNKR